MRSIYLPFVPLLRTHDELLAWGLQDDVCGNVDGDEDLLLMSIVHGPSEAKFKDDKPARLRFLVGYLKDIKSEIQGESEVSRVIVMFGGRFPEFLPYFF